jgi:hypothetical protein
VNSWYHAKSCANHWGGTPEDYLPIHEFIDSSKQAMGDYRHRAMYHHTLGVYLCQQIFGKTIKVQKKTKVIDVPVRLIAERHIVEDLGYLPSPEHYFKHIPFNEKPTLWMSGAQRKEVGNFNDIFNKGAVSE